jgi:hypothetical protein
MRYLQRKINFIADSLEVRESSMSLMTLTCMLELTLALFLLTQPLVNWAGQLLGIFLIADASLYVFAYNKYRKKSRVE